ncbi:MULTISPECIES: nucleotidyl transferase AbiEii/AbiGii toxin family protein [unclassified Actinomyces]|uniref:nucleotidyl transferase AbiEii/AbiGii toxin family protein n=1 Tax=unclassified Actinomyces TaxID=2609248 RepID=UPI000D59C8D5|nr:MULTISPECIES: nucleotidyl transferase AbiEii/AbiGii toxin family protein [unclassified Actinomyces]RAX20037.1 hypothetical protein DRB06_09995 [Actinomyces sp. Z5]RAX22506.1 hypothetical protein DRB07_08240 [Actinomyces sp. Z3]
MIEPLAASRLRQSLNSRIRAEASRRGVTADDIRQQYVFALLTKRLFADDMDDWLLLGGNALLIRTRGGRFTRDVDLARTHGWSDVQELRDELRSALSRSLDSDPFRLEIVKVSPHSEPDGYGYGALTAKADIRVLLGVAEFGRFSIDITTRRHVSGPIDRISPTPIIDHETIADLPDVPTVPVENHLADKICALYELHGKTRTASTRYRDLADIVRIVAHLDFDAARLSEMLDHESRRRRIPQPTAIVSPSPAWEQAYPRQAREFAEFPTEFHSLDASLDAAAACLDEVLNGSRSKGRWDHASAQWRG